MQKRLITILIFSFVFGFFVSDVGSVFAGAEEDSFLQTAFFQKRLGEKNEQPSQTEVQAPELPQPQDQLQPVQQPEAPQPEQPKPQDQLQVQQPEAPKAEQPKPQDQPQPLQQLETPKAAQPFMQPLSSMTVVKQPAGRKGDVSFNFDDADVFSVIQTIFGDVLKVNYIVDSRVKGRVNFRSVAPVAKENVLSLMEVILRLNGIGIVEEGGLYRIIPIGDLAKEPASIGMGRETEAIQTTGKAIVQIVPLKYIQSTEMIRILTPFLSLNAVVIDVPKSNHIIIVDTDANVKRLVQLVGMFDGENLKQIKPRVFVYAVQNSKAKDVASLLQQIFLGAKSSSAEPSGKTATPAKAPVPGQTQQTQQTPALQPKPQISAGTTGGESLVSENTRIIPDEITNTIVVLGSPEDYAIILAALQQIDIVPRQVMIEALLVRIDLTDNLSFGFSWSLNTDVNIKGINPFTRDINLGGAVTSQPFGTTLDSKPGTGFTFVGTDPSGFVRARVVAALKDSKGKILAAPHILVSDNREARIQIGKQIPLATSTTTTPLAGATNTTTSTVQYKDTGNILTVKPQVNDSGLVSLEIAQENSDIGEVVKIADQDFASIQKTEATTSLVVQDGETIIIGGLIQETTSKVKDGIPILSKIPLIGSLFSNTTDNTTRTELILLLTPHVIKTQQEAQRITREYIDRFEEKTKIKIDEVKKDKVKEETGGGDAVDKGPRQDNP